MARRIATLFVLALALVSFGWAEPAYACSCVRYASADEHLRETDLVFTGRVVRSVKAPRRGEGRPMMLTTFADVRVLKGATTRTVRVRHPEDICCVCGVTFTRGRTVTVFAHRYQDILATSSCSQAQHPWPEYEKALARLRQEGAAQPPSGA